MALAEKNAGSRKTARKNGGFAGIIFEYEPHVVR